MRGLSFIADNELYAVDVTSVMKVVRHIETTPVPAVSNAVVGIVNIKGMVITILSLPALLGYERTEDYHSMNSINAIIFKSIADGSDQMGLLIDTPGDLITIDEESIQPLPMNVGFEEKQTISGLADIDGTLYRIVDITSIINRFSDSGTAVVTGKQEEN